MGGGGAKTKINYLRTKGKKIGNPLFLIHVQEVWLGAVKKTTKWRQKNDHEGEEQPGNP